MPALGWNPHREDTAFLRAGTGFLRSIPPTFKAPEKIDHRPWRASKIKDQLQKGSCVGHGGSGCCELQNYIDTKGGEVTLSADYVYYTSQKIAGLLGKDSGSTISACIKSLSSDGVCLEDTMPYREVYDPKIEQAAYSEGEQHLALSSHDPTDSYEDDLRALQAGATILLGIEWVESLANAGETVTKLSGQAYGYHCVFEHGYVYINGELYFVMENSHGKRYGNNGFTLIHWKVQQQFHEKKYHEVHAVSNFQEYGGGRFDFLTDGPMW